VTLRARFPNPQGVLLPGMFVRAVFRPGDRYAGAFLVPQAGVSPAIPRAMPRSGGRAGQRAVARTVVADRTIGPNWVVTQGLAPGDKVIVQGTANLKPDAEIKPVPARPAEDRAAQQGRQKRRRPQGQGRLILDVAHLHRSPDLRLGDRDHRHAGRARRDLLAADRAISRYRAAPGQYPRDLSGRVGGDDPEQRHPGDRAAAYRHRRAALFQLLVQLARPGEHLGHVREGHRSGHRPGPGAEPGPAGAFPPAAAGAAAGPARHQVQSGSAAARRRL
jgi:hypothetical protein